MIFNAETPLAFAIVWSCVKILALEIFAILPTVELNAEPTPVEVKVFPDKDKFEI